MKENQTSFFYYIVQGHNKSKSSRFLEEMDKVIPWKELVKLIEKHIPKRYRGRKRKDTELMLRGLCLAQWYNLSDPGLEDAINDRISFQKFLGLDLSCEQAPDETTFVKFRHFLEEHNLYEQIFKKITELLEKKSLILKQGTLVDATITKAPSSTKNKSKRRDPEMSSTKKGNQYYFGMKTHIGVDMKHGLVHSLTVTTAKKHDSKQLKYLLHGKEQFIGGDKAYCNQALKREHRSKGIIHGILDKAPRGKKLSSSQRKRNHKLSKVRSIVEFPFHVVKHLWGHKKVRYKGLFKNRCHQYFLYALANLYRVRKLLLNSA